MFNNFIMQFSMLNTIYKTIKKYDFFYQFFLIINHWCFGNEEKKEENNEMSSMGLVLEKKKLIKVEVKCEF